MESKRIKVKIEGVSPLLMNKFTGGTDDKKSARGKKVYVPTEEAEKKTYRTDEGKLFLPSTHFKSSMIKAGTDFKMEGRKSYKEFIKSGVFITPMEILLTPQEYIIHEEPVVIQRARVLSWRPKLMEWSCEFEIEITDDFINSTTLKEILETAGKYKAVGDYRPEYGRFKVVEWKVI